MRASAFRPVWILFSIAILLLFAGCGEDDKNGDSNPLGPVNESLVGTWQTQRIIAFPGSVNLEYTPEDSLFILITVTLKDDNTLTYQKTEQGETTNGTGTWSATSTTATIALSDGMTLSGNFTLNEDGTLLTVNATLPFDLTPNDDTDENANIPVTVEFVKLNE
jgi:hypothetical protein